MQKLMHLGKPSFCFLKENLNLQTFSPSHSHSFPSPKRKNERKGERGKNTVKTLFFPHLPLSSKKEIQGEKERRKCASSSISCVRKGKEALIFFFLFQFLFSLKKKKKDCAFSSVSGPFLVLEKEKEEGEREKIEREEVKPLTHLTHYSDLSSFYSSFFNTHFFEKILFKMKKMCRMCQRRGGFLSLFSFCRGAGKEIENPYFFLFFFLFSKREGDEARGFEIFFFISFSLPPRKKKEEENEEKIYFLIVFSFIPFI